MLQQIITGSKKLFKRKIAFFTYLFTREERLDLVTACYSILRTSAGSVHSNREKRNTFVIITYRNKREIKIFFWHISWLEHEKPNLLLFGKENSRNNNNITPLYYDIFCASSLVTPWLVLWLTSKGFSTLFQNFTSLMCQVTLDLSAIVSNFEN